MGDRPIIFSAPMVRALLDGRKTQTRWVLKPQPFEAGGTWCVRNRGDELPLDIVVGGHGGLFPWAQGDRLWVREGWQAWTHLDRAMAEDLPQDARERLNYPADGNIWNSRERPSIHMPRWASRLTLPVKQVRVERLQDISEADARAEGAMLHVPCKSAVAGTTIASDSWYFDQDLNGRLYEDSTARGAFEILWGKINGWKSWDANPWVAAISFEVHHANIDALLTSEAAA